MDNDLLKKLKGICNSLTTDQLCYELKKVSSNYGYEEIKNKLQDIMKNHHDNKDIVIKCVLIDGGSIGKASERLKNDIDVARAAVLLTMDTHNDNPTSEYAFNQLSDQLKDNKDFVLEVIKNNEYCIRYVSQRLLDDKDVVIAAGIEGLKATETLKNDRDVLINLAKNQPWFLEDAPSSVRKNVEIVNMCCRLQPMLIQYAHPDLTAELMSILYQEYKKKGVIKNG